MSIVKSIVISFPPSASPDVASYKLYMEEQPNPVTYQSQNWNIGKNTSVDLSTLEGMTSKDGTYNIGVAAVDSAGNESSMSTKEGVVLDFVAPDPPGEITVSRS